MPLGVELFATFQGDGANLIYLEWEHDLVVVARWIDSKRDFDQFIGEVIEATSH
jgi:hypothetical protein